ncbi:hypothetical protein Ahy_B06g084177 isoform D [Arachis hypogaea]|nr:hypothetical protein Ahy_B06g084177 isoform D [Arachis hypogaea]
MVQEYLMNFGVAPTASECKGSFIKLTWLRSVKHGIMLTTHETMERIRTYSWGSACLAHLYRSLCRATQYDCKDLDGPLALLHVWAWERMPFLAPIRRHLHWHTLEILEHSWHRNPKRA